MDVEEFIQRLSEIAFLNFASYMAWLYRGCIYCFLRDVVLFHYILRNFVWYLKMKDKFIPFHAVK